MLVPGHAHGLGRVRLGPHFAAQTGPGTETLCRLRVSGTVLGVLCAVPPEGIWSSLQRTEAVSAHVQSGTNAQYGGPGRGGAGCGSDGLHGRGDSRPKRDSDAGKLLRPRAVLSGAVR
eukprot:2779784-Rhodomonas_salina.2